MAIVNFFYNIASFAGNLLTDKSAPIFTDLFKRNALMLCGVALYRKIWVFILLNSEIKMLKGNKFTEQALDMFSEPIETFTRLRTLAIQWNKITRITPKFALAIDKVKCIRTV